MTTTTTTYAQIVEAAAAAIRKTWWLQHKARKTDEETKIKVFEPKNESQNERVDLRWRLYGGSDLKPSRCWTNRWRNRRDRSHLNPTELKPVHLLAKFHSSISDSYQPAMDLVASSKLSGGLFGSQAPANGGNDLATQTPEPLTHEEWVQLKEDVSHEVLFLKVRFYSKRGCIQYRNFLTIM
jgi:hypothetical protein